MKLTEDYKDEYIKIDLWSRPLKKHRYSKKTDVQKKTVQNIDGLSGILTSEFRKLHGKQSLFEDTAGTKFSDSFDNDSQENQDEFNLDLGSQILMNEPEEFKLARKKQLDDYETEDNRNALISEASGNIEDDAASNTNEKKANKPKKESLRIKIDRLLYDYSEIKQEKIEQEVDALINQDGYYNEVIPIDEGIDFEEKKEFNKGIIVVVALLIVTAVALVMVIRS